MGGDDADSNCDGSDDVDADGDLVPTLSPGGTDCDDANVQVFPGAVETCNGLDDNSGVWQRVRRGRGRL
ncbi:MAG: hypothetical protein ACJATT_004099 [Myxococcota bacterium]